MTKIDRPEVQDRVTVMDDEKKRALDLYDLRLVPPEGVGIFDAPTRCYTINLQWAKIVMGMVSWLAEVAPWRDAQHEGYPAILEIQKFLAGDNCADCTIQELLDDPTFFEEEYIPATFGELYTETIAHNEALNTAYDGTPQSIGSDIPIGPPDDVEKNALCYAIHSFVNLYASAKLCIIQSKNFLQVALNTLQEAINKTYNLIRESMAFIYTPNLFSCFVDDAEAITVLQDAGAIEELACFLYDELKAVTISQSNFDDALLAAATTLTGNAGKLACIMQNDSNLTVYLNFLEAYQIALNRAVNNDELDCPCEDEDYALWIFRFTSERGISYQTGGFAGSIISGVYVEDEGWRVTNIGSGDGLMQVGFATDPSWVFVAAAYRSIVAPGAQAIHLRPNPSSATGAIGLNMTGGTDWTQYDNFVDTPRTGINEFAFRVANTLASNQTVTEIAFKFQAAHAPAGAILVSSPDFS